MSHQGIGKGVKCRDGRKRTTAHPQSDARTQFVGRAPPEREHEYVIGSERFVGVSEAGDHRLDDGRRLSGARAGQDQQGTATMGHHRLLIRVERGLAGGQRRLPIESPDGVAHYCEYRPRV